MGKLASVRSRQYSEEGEPLTVQGKSASSYEHNFARALHTVDLDFLFQVSYWGGRSFRGGIVMDFLVFTPPIPTPCAINGGYWHRGQKAAEDEIAQATLYHRMNGDLQPVKVFWDEDCNTYEAALNAVRRELA